MTNALCSPVMRLSVSVPRLDLITVVPSVDHDLPRHGSPLLSGQCAFAPGHEHVREHDGFARKVPQPHDIVIVGDVIGVSAAHPVSPSAMASHSRVQENTEPFADAKILIATFAN
ncbi:hypothetical protein ACUSIJ_24815 [Pseudochelatococcus sp. B33]